MRRPTPFPRAGLHASLSASTEISATCREGTLERAACGIEAYGGNRPMADIRITASTPARQRPIAQLVIRCSKLPMRRALLATYLLAAVWCAPLRSEGAEAAQEVSLVALLANPQSYEGKLIRVEGFFDGSHFESCQLFLSKADFDSHIDRNSIFVRWPGCFDRRSAAKVQRRYALVEGVFRADIGAGFGSFSEVREVRRLEPIVSRADLQMKWRAPWWLDLWPWLQLAILFVAVTTGAAYLIARRLHRR